MAFATEHPVVAHSEYRAVDEIVRTGARFEVVSPHDPAGDQPAAIDELERRILAGERDLSTPLAWARQEALLAPDGQLVTVPGAGHSVQLRAGDAAVRKLLARFLAG